MAWYWYGLGDSSSSQAESDIWYTFMRHGTRLQFLDNTFVAGSHPGGLVFLPELQFAHSRYEEKGWIWLSSGATPLLEPHARVVDSLPVTLPSIPTAYSPIGLSSATLFLPNFPTTSPASSSNSFSEFTPLLISFLTTFDSPLFLTVCFPSSLKFPALSHCIILPLSLQAPSFHQPTSSLFPFHHSSPCLYHCSSLNSPTSFVRSAGPYPSLSPVL